MLLRAFPANAVSHTPFYCINGMPCTTVVGLFPWLRDSNESVRLFIPINVVNYLMIRYYFNVIVNIILVYLSYNNNEL